MTQVKWVCFCSWTCYLRWCGRCMVVVKSTWTAESALAQTCSRLSLSEHGSSSSDDRSSTDWHTMYDLFFSNAVGVLLVCSEPYLQMMTWMYILIRIHKHCLEGYMEMLTYFPQKPLSSTGRSLSNPNFSLNPNFHCLWSHWSF